jgi:citrate synthase
MSAFLTTEQAAGLLGVKAATVYAYVSRGQLTRHPGPDRRSSRFDRAEVERLAAHNRRGGRAGALEVVIDTGLSLLEPAGALHYRGRDATRLARTHTFEQVADLLWDEPDQHDRATVGAGGPWRADPEVVRAARAALAGIGSGRLRPPDALRVVVAAAAGLDPLRGDRRPAAVTATARALIATMVDALATRPTQADPPDRAAGDSGGDSPSGSGGDPPGGPGGGAGGSVAGRLFEGLTGRVAGAAELRAVQAALILCADHELATAALATRVAASVRADPYLAVLAGLAALGGQLHGGGVSATEALLRELWRSDEEDRLIGERLAAGPVPGFGHTVYTARDPRSDTLRELSAGVGGDRAARWDGVVRRLVAAVGAHGGPAPNMDLALAELSVRANFARGGAEAAFMVGRVAGLVGHTLEEYPHRYRFRPRAVYIGPRPG